MEEKINISEIAKKLGVSISTVSRAINGKKGVSDKQREKILAYVRETGYRANPFLLQEGYSPANKIVAIILGDIRNPFYADLVFNIQKILNEQGYMVIIFNSEYDIDREISQLNTINNNNFAGLILVTASVSRIKDKIDSMNMPAVLVNRIVPGYEGDSVLTDNFQAGYLAAMHLIELNHKKIGFIKGHCVSSASSQRYSGYMQAMNNYSLPVDDRFVYDGCLKVESGEQAAEEFLKLDKEQRPTAMIAVNDLTAIGFMNVCRRHNILFPQDVSLVGFDDIWCSSAEGINLTTVSQHVEEMSQRAANMLLERMGGKEKGAERIIITPSLILRGTTGSPHRTE